MSCSFGDNIKLTVFGQSHSESIGCVLDGVPAGERVDIDSLLSFAARSGAKRIFNSAQRGRYTRYSFGHNRGYDLRRTDMRRDKKHKYTLG